MRTITRSGMLRISPFANFPGIIIASNCVAMVVRIIEPSNSLVESAHEFAACWDTLLFGGREYKCLINIKTSLKGMSALHN